jgi:hypothetical protein
MWVLIPSGRLMTGRVSLENGLQRALLELLPILRAFFSVSSGRLERSLSKYRKVGAPTNTSVLKLLSHLKLSLLPQKLPIRPVKSKKELERAYISLFLDRPSPGHWRFLAGHYSGESSKDIG